MGSLVGKACIFSAPCDTWLDTAMLDIMCCFISRGRSTGCGLLCCGQGVIAVSCVRVCMSTHLQYIITSSTFYQNNSWSLISTSTCVSVECILEVLMHSGGKNKGELTFLEARGALLYFFSPNNDRDTWVLSCVPHCKEDTWKHSLQVQVFWCSRHEIPLNCWPLVVGFFHAMLY